MLLIFSKIHISLVKILTKRSSGTLLEPICSLNLSFPFLYSFADMSCSGMYGVVCYYYYAQSKTIKSFNAGTYHIADGPQW